LRARVCQYENTSNGDFLIDRHPEFENVWLVGGGSGHGFKHGPAVGEYVAARINGGSEGIEPRFTLATKKPDLNEWFTRRSASGSDAVGRCGTGVSPVNHAQDARATFKMHSRVRD
jgi:glycine/D-amino acid oxidase-like deaminating enzyme